MPLIPRVVHCSKKQQEYLHILFNDLGFDLKQRNIMLSEWMEKEILYLDELSMIEASFVIDKLKAMK